MEVVLGFLVLWLICGVVTGIIASSKGRSGLGWFLVGCLLGIFGVLLVGFLPSLIDSRPVYSGVSFDRANHSNLPVRSNFASSPQNRLMDANDDLRSATSLDSKKWQVLKEVDPEIAAAASRLALLDHKLEVELAEKYLILNDKTYLSAIEEQLAQRYRASQAKMQAMVGSRDSDQAESALREIKEYESIVSANGQIDPKMNVRVTKVEPYFGKWKMAQGGIKISMEDGRVVLKKDSFRRVFDSEKDTE